MESGGEKQSSSLSTNVQWDWVCALAGPLNDFHILVLIALDVCLGSLSCWNINLCPQSKVVCSLKQVLIKDWPVFGSIHYSLDPYQFPSPCRWKASPQHDATITMFHGRDDVKWVMSCAWFSPDIALCIQAKYLFLSHQTTESIASCSESFTCLFTSTCLFLRSGFCLATLP